MSNKIFGTHEWASSTFNYINGCSHDCKYCYSKEMSIRFKRKTKDTWKNEEVDESKVCRNYGKKNGRIMFPSSHDITRKEIPNCLKILSKMLRSGNEILIVSKPHLEVIQKICCKFTNYKNKITFRFSIGSCDNDLLRFWEPFAPSFTERIASLKHAFNFGFRTSISCEPLLDTQAEELMQLVMPFITDAMWIGKPNFLLRRIKVNGFDKDTITYKWGEKLINELSDSYILDLFERNRTNPKVKWKESIKKIVGLPLLVKKGIDE